MCYIYKFDLEYIKTTFLLSGVIEWFQAADLQDSRMLHPRMQQRALMEVETVTSHRCEA